MNADQATGQSVLDFGQRWAQAERAGDADTLDTLATDDFTLVGPLGFVVTKQQWLDRYRNRDLVTSALDWHDVAVRSYGETAVAVGVHTQQAAYHGQPNDGSFRATHVLIRTDGQWLLAGMHLSPISAPPGRPPRP